MNTNQMRRARALAWAHGHGWANPDPEIHGAMALDLAPTLAAAKAAWAQYVAEYAETYPSHDPGLPPAVEHVTGTGRTRWRVDENGLATITIARPSGDVIRAVVTASGLVRIDVLGPHAARHVGALVTCLRGLEVDDAEVARAIRVAGVDVRAVGDWAAEAASWRAQAAERAALSYPEEWAIVEADRARVAADRAAAIASACAY